MAKDVNMGRKPKLTPEEAAEVREAYFRLRGPLTVRQIANLFRVDPAIVHKVIDRKGAYKDTEETRCHQREGSQASERS